MNGDKTVVIIAGVLLSGLVGYALWLMFSWPPTSTEIKMTPTPDSTVIEQQVQATPSPILSTPTPQQQGTNTKTELKKIEAEFNSTVILDEDFSELEGE